MSKPDANFGGGKKNTVYHFIQELIQEGKCAWFVNREGRFRIKWEIAVERYIEYRAKKNPEYDLCIDRRKASNSFREALLHRYCDGTDGAKEYEECRKVGEKNKIVEREFQLPSKVFHSLFGSSEELVGDQSETSGISVCDPEFTREDKSLQLLGDLDYEVHMEPKESRLEGGRPFRVSFHPCLDANVTSVHAVFVKLQDILGNVELFISPSCLFGHSIPGAPSSGWANVIFKDQNDNHLGSTEIFYFPDGVEAVAMVQTPDQFKNFCWEMSSHTSSFDSSDGDPQRYGAFGNAQQVQFLCLLIHTAAREGAQQFIEMIFSTSAGRLVFDAYKDSQPLPEVVARDHGQNETACYLEGMTKRFSVRTSASKEYLKKINWSELVQAAEEVQTECNAENESCHLMSDLSKDAGYLGDLETSSSELHGLGSEDDTFVESKKGNKDSVYLFIKELIQEGEYAWFVNDQGRFLIKWDKAVELYIEYRATKNPKFKKVKNQRKASNALRAALVHHFENDGAKEFAESRKLGGQTKVIERQFQMPSSVFQSLFGSSVEITDKHNYASGDKTDTGEISVSDPELKQEDQGSLVRLHENLNYDADMTPKQSSVQTDTGEISGSNPELKQEDQGSLEGLHENLNYDVDVTPKQSSVQTDTGEISGSDPELKQEDQGSLEGLHENLNYDVDMTPKQSSVQGGDPFHVTFSPSLDERVTFVYAVFVKSDSLLGTVEMVIDHLLGHKIPGASSSGWGKVIFKDDNGIRLGSTKLFYYPDDREEKVMVKTPSLFVTLCKDMSCHKANSYTSSDEKPHKFGSFVNAEQVQLLYSLVVTAAKEGAQQFIEIIFSSSAGRLVFDAYKNSPPLPEVVAKDHGHIKIACYLEGVTKRFSEEAFAVEEYPKAIDWSELAKAAEEAQRKHELHTFQE